MGWLSNWFGHDDDGDAAPKEERESFPEQFDVCEEFNALEQNIHRDRSGRLSNHPQNEEVFRRQQDVLGDLTRQGYEVYFDDYEGKWKTR